MKTAKLVDVGKFHIEEVAVPQIEMPTQIQVKVMAVGICGTDLHIFKSGRSDVKLPRVMGHELSGIVTAVGSEVTRVKVGDRVVLDPVFSCDRCNTCRKGYPNVCENVKCYGVQMDGGYQEYIVEDEKHFYSFNSRISFENAALAEPFSIGANILDRAQIKPKENVLIIGAGTIGLSIASLSKGIGANVVVSDIVQTKLNKAKAMGVDGTINSQKDDLETAAFRFCPEGFDVIIDAVGVTALFERCLAFAAPRARIACIGFDANPAQIPPVIITKKELSIIGSRMNCHQFPKVMQLLAEGKIDASSFISRTYHLSEIQKAFEETLAHSDEVVKTLILCGES